ncbi:MAG TPA: hypothetical protein VFU19_09620, partial [Iamia sp.]|nr:hypothetical protein [Iamia sp.]
TRRLLGAVIALAVALLVPATPAGAADLDPTRPVERVVIVALPGVSWAEARRGTMPVLDQLVRESAVGVMSSQIGRGPATTTAAYLTIGAGTRSVVPRVDTGVALNPDELHGGVSATDILRRRLGGAVPGIAYLPVGAALDVNADSTFGAVPGTLGDELARAGIARAVIANADAAEGFPIDELPPDGAYSRSAATALMGRDGIVPEGTVGRDLLMEDPEAPFGRRFARSAVLDALDRSWLPDRREVVLLEASDLSRAAAYGSRSTPEQRVALRRQALEDADALLGDVLDRVDPETDAVIVLSATAPGGSGIVALRAPDVEPGLLRSATTRRAGYVLLADVAPTVLTLMGVEPPTAIEGRAFGIEPARGFDRVGSLIDQGVAARSRDDRLPVVVQVVIAALALLVAAVAAGDRVPARVRRALGPIAIGMLGVVPGTFLAGHLQDGRQGIGLYALAVVATAVAVGVAGTLAERRWPRTGILVGLGSILLLIAGDVLVGAPLQVNTVFGYSTAVAGRFAGLGNLAFALFSAAALTFAVILVDRGGRRAPAGAVALLVAAVLIDGLPMLGADVGGVASMVPAFLLTAWVLAGRQVRWPHLVASGVASFLAIVAVGLLDASRPTSSQTHLARLGEHVVNRRFEAVGDTLVRRVNASFGSTDSFVWVLALALVGAALVHAAVVARGRGWLARLRPRDTTSLALAIGLGALAVLGLVVNDSSIAVPATMLIVIVPVLVTRRLDRTAPGATA